MALYINGKQISGGGGGNTNSVELTYAEYQALTPAQQLDGTEYFITDINGDGQQFQPICYSDEEKEIGVWVDGRPVYQKTVTGTFSNATYLNISVADLDVLAILEIEGILLASDSANIVNIGSDDAGAVRFSHTAITPGSTLEYITISKNDASSYGTTSQVYATLRYTKSTDTAGSGTWTPQGVPAHHYSTDEQVVGTWVDGNTLYEKTLIFNNVQVTQSDSTSGLVHNVSNIGSFKRVTEAYVDFSGGQNWIPAINVIAPSSSNDYIVKWAVGDTSITLVYRGELSLDASVNRSYLFTIQYTKSST
jgi:hypothetical protein